MAVHFLNAGLPNPSMFRKIPVSSGEDSPFYLWMAETLRSVTPVVHMDIFPTTLSRLTRQAQKMLRSRRTASKPLCKCAPVRI
jgi:hypothetical protein